MAKKPLPTRERLRQLLRYEPDTGQLYWLPRVGKWSSRWNARYAGTIAGALDGSGYIQIKVDDRNNLAHRIIWMMVHGEWPEVIDHINGDPSDNRLANLRNVSQGVNQRNQKQHCSNTSGITGVTWFYPTKKWLAFIRYNGKQIHLGHYEKIEDAARARKAAEKRFGFTGRV